MDQGIWAQFLALFFEAIFLFSFGKAWPKTCIGRCSCQKQPLMMMMMMIQVDNSQPWYVALAVLVCFSLFVQMAEAGPTQQTLNHVV